MTIWLLMLLACGDVRVTRPEPEQPVGELEAWRRARAGMTHPSNCYLQRPEYCVTEPAVVDGMIQLLLDREFYGRMPSRPRWVREVVRDARKAYARWMRTPEGRRAVAARVQAWYEEPDVEIVEGRGVSVRVGVPPGRVQVVGSWSAEAPLTVSSPLVVDGEWETREIARFLEHYLERYPDQPVIRLVVTLPRGASHRRMDIRYHRALDRISVVELGGEADHAWVTEPLGGDLGPFREGARSLHTRALTTCPLDERKEPRCEERTAR